MRKTKDIIIFMIILMSMILITPTISQAALQSNGNTPPRYILDDWMWKVREMQQAGGTLGLTDTIEYENMDIRSMKRYIRHTAGQNEAYPAGLYVALADGSLYHSSFVPDPDFDVLSRKWYTDGIQSEDFILGDTYIDEASQSYVVGASGVL